MSGGPGEGARDPEQAEAAPEGGQLGPRGAGEETGDKGHAAGRKKNARRVVTCLLAVLFRSMRCSDCRCLCLFFQDCLALPVGKSEICGSAGAESEVTVKSRKRSVMFPLVMFLPSLKMTSNSTYSFILT